MFPLAVMCVENSAEVSFNLSKLVSSNLKSKLSDSILKLWSEFTSPANLSANIAPTLLISPSPKSPDVAFIVALVVMSPPTFIVEVDEPLMFPLDVILVLVKFVMLADGDDKNTSATSVCPQLLSLICC